GDSNFITSTSNSLSQEVKKADTTSTITSSLSTSTFGQSVTFTATVTTVAPGVGTATGTVTVKDGGLVIGTATLAGGTASISISTLSGGSHSITVEYSGSSNFNGSTSAALIQTVNKADTTTSVTVSPTTSAFGQTLTFNVTVSVTGVGAGTPNGSVEVR